MQLATYVLFSEFIFDLPGELPESYARPAQKEGILGDATAYRSRDIICRVFLPRFFKPNDQLARVLRLWQHEIKQDFEGCITRIIAAVRDSPSEENR